MWGVDVPIAMGEWNVEVDEARNRLYIDLSGVFGEEVGAYLVAEAESVERAEKLLDERRKQEIGPLIFVGEN